MMYMRTYLLGASTSVSLSSGSFLRMATACATIRATKNEFIDAAERSQETREQLEACRARDLNHREVVRFGRHDFHKFGARVRLARSNLPAKFSFYQGEA